MEDEAAGPRIPPPLFFAAAVASIGGPLALAALYVPGAADTRSAALTALTGTALAALPLGVWLRYSEDVVSAGGLAAFVEAAAGRRLALAQAAVWSFSYFLYLPYTVTDIVYEQLVVVFPGVSPWRSFVELLLPSAIVGVVLLGTLPALRLLAVAAVAQLVLTLALAWVELAHAGAPARSLTTAHGLPRGAADTGLLFVCASLPLFLGAEAVGGARTIRRSLAGAWAVVGGYVTLAVLPLAAVAPALLRTAIPGYSIASAYSGRALGVAVGVGVSASVAGLIVAEYLALSRLLHAVTRLPVRRLLLWIGIPFVALDAVSLLDPEEFDHQTLRPSLVALFVSQLIVVVVFPRHRARRGRLGPADLVLAVGATALFAWGLYQAVTAPVAS